MFLNRETHSKVLLVMKVLYLISNVSFVRGFCFRNDASNLNETLRMHRFIQRLRTFTLVFGDGERCWLRR